MRERLALLVAILSTSLCTAAVVDPAHLAAYAVVFAVCLAATAFVAVRSSAAEPLSPSLVLEVAHVHRSSDDDATGARRVVNRR